jgi:hypothetical protein
MKVVSNQWSVVSEDLMSYPMPVYFRRALRTLRLYVKKIYEPVADVFLNQFSIFSGKLTEFSGNIYKINSLWLFSCAKNCQKLPITAKK